MSVVDLTAELANLSCEVLQLREEVAKRLEHVKRLTRERDQLTAVLEFIYGNTSPAKIANLGYLGAARKQLEMINRLTEQFVVESGA